MLRKSDAAKLRVTDKADDERVFGEPSDPFPLQQEMA